LIANIIPPPVYTYTHKYIHIYIYTYIYIYIYIYNVGDPPLASVPFSKNASRLGGWSSNNRDLHLPGAFSLAITAARAGLGTPLQFEPAIPSRVGQAMIQRKLL
jgi:hypothetical protein